MNITPPKIPPLPLSEQHQSSIKKSKDMSRLVDAFLEKNFNPVNLKPPLNMEKSSESLQNSKAFFQSQMNILITMIGHMKRLYSQKQTENIGLKKMIDQYEKKLKSQKNYGQAKQTADKSKVLAIGSYAKEDNERKTRKKSQNEDHDVFKAAQSAISEFHYRSSPIRKQSHEKESNLSLQLKIELNQLKIVNKELQEKLRSKNRQSNENLQEYRTTKESFRKSVEEVKNLCKEKEKFIVEESILKDRLKTLEKQYLDLEDKHGKTVAEYQIKIENLRQVLRGIKQHASPRKPLEKEELGYYSINRSLNRNQSQQSFTSSNQSQQSLTQSHIQVNLKQQNQYLRNQLIKSLDQKGSLKSKVHKLQKIIDKYENQLKQEKRKAGHMATDENNQNLSNAQISRQNSKINQQTHSFKKNKNTSILVVENTEKKQKEMLEQQKTSNLLNQVCEIISDVTQNIINIEFEDKQYPAQYPGVHFLQTLVKALKIYAQKTSKVYQLLNQTQKQNEKLKNQIDQAQLKDRKDIDEVRSFLRQITQNPSQVKSSDSTDKAFKGIQIEQNVKDLKNNEINFQIIESEQDFRKALQKKFLTRERQYQQRIQQLERQVLNLKSQISQAEQVSQSLYQLTNQSQSQSQLKIPSNPHNQLVPVSNGQNQAVYSTQSRCLLEMSHFQLFKQKLTQFYQQTIQELDQWEISAFKNSGLSPRKQPEIKGEIHQELKFPSVQIIQRNIMKVSQQFKSIKEGSFDEQCSSRNKHGNEQFFKDQKMSRSFVAEEESLDDLINKRLTEFQKYSSALVTQFIPRQQEKQLNQIEKMTKTQPFKEEIYEITKLQRLSSIKTERPSVERLDESQMNDIDARSQSVSSSQLMRQRQLFIREEVSYYVERTDRPSYLMNSLNSRKSTDSFKIFSPDSKQ